jgi:hypothetical protein
MAVGVVTAAEDITTSIIEGRNHDQNRNLFRMELLLNLKQETVLRLLTRECMIRKYQGWPSPC